MERKWWHNATIYQIYPRSFQDSNADGIGDLRGIIQRLDYLEKLGITAIWLSPVYQSPNADNGYDIADYFKIMPEFGTMADMEELIQKAGQRGIKIIMDLVVNHTSDEHQWFIEAKKAKDNRYRDYYIWHDPVLGHEPNDLKSLFGGSAWQYDEQTGQYYLHFFSKKQPDLNWANPKMRQDIYKMMDFWIDKGIGGFRMDVIEMLGKEPDKLISTNGPKLHAYIQEMNQKTFGQHDLLTVGEAWSANPEIAKLYSNPARHELSQIFQFETTFADQAGDDKWHTKELDIPYLKRTLVKWQKALGDEGWNSLFWDNHDLPRAVSQYGDDRIYRIESAKMLAIVLHLLKGTPYVYQGEELGMTNCPVQDISEVNDIESQNMYAEEISKGAQKEDLLAKINKKGRDNARTPMQWDKSLNAGFTKGQPWLHVNTNYPVINAQACLEDKNSIFYTYQQLIAYRKQHDLVVYGDFTEIETGLDGVFCYVRQYQGQKLLVCANFTNQLQKLSLKGFPLLKALIANYAEGVLDLSQKVLKPYEAFACEIKD